MMFKNYYNFAAIFLPLTIFTKEIGMFTISSINIDLIGYPFFILSFVLFFITRNISISNNETIVFAIILFMGLIQSFILNLPIIIFFKQFIPIAIFYFVIKSILTYRDPIYIFDKYVQYAMVAAYLGLLQFVLKLVGIKFLTGHSQLFIDSVALEPSHYVVMMIPAMIYYFEKRNFNKNFFILTLTLVLTFKLTALLSFATYYFLRNIKNFKTMVFISPLILLISIYIINHNEEFGKRIDSAVIFMETNDMSSIENMTTFSFISNLEVATENFIDTFGVGTGLGGHETTYGRIFRGIDIYSDDWVGMNMKSAHSLLIRIISELGLFGLIILFLLFYKSYSIRNFEYRVVAWASLSHFVAKFFKTGSYFDYGSIFFLVMIIVMIRLDYQDSKSIESK